MKILVTSFGPFGAFDNNPSERLMNDLKARSLEDRLDVQIEWSVLPVSYSSVDAYLETLDSEYDLIIHMGVASNESVLRFEVIGRNIRGGTDNDGQIFADTEIVAGASSLESSFPKPILNELIDTRLESTKISTDAGDYLCNYIYFKSLHKFGQAVPILFIHIADVDHQPQAPSLAQQADIVEDLITRYAGH
jgi:pyroglutamyl-peptidase